jgi:hypothetical protein
MGINFRIVIAAALLSWACLSTVGSARAEQLSPDSYSAYLIAQVSKARDFEKVPRAKALESYIDSMDGNQLASLSDDTIDRLAKLLTDDDDAVKAMAARSLGKIGKRAARSLTALQCARVLPEKTSGSGEHSPAHFMQQAIDNINAQGGDGGMQSLRRTDAVAWNSLSFCSATGYCVNVAESDAHRIARLEIKFNGQDVPLSAGLFDAIDHPSINDIRLVSVGQSQRLDIPFTGKVLSLTLDQGRVVANSTH